MNKMKKNKYFYHCTVYRLIVGELSVVSYISGVTDIDLTGDNGLWELQNQLRCKTVGILESDTFDIDNITKL